MAGLRPGHPRLPYLSAAKTWMPGIADKFTQSAQGRLLWPGMTSFATETDFIGCFLSQTLRCNRGARYPNGRVKMFGWFVGIVISAVVISSGAWSQQTLQQLESVSQFGQALAAVDAIKKRKHLQCVIAIANRPLCQCLSRKLPVDIYFRSYASIANQERDGLDYGRLSAADKTIVDQCVGDSR
jgi:hypothetical protein